MDKENKMTPHRLASESAMGANHAVCVRDAAPADAAAIVALLHQLGYEIAANVVDAKLRGFAASPSDKILVATIGDDVIGSIGLHATPLLHIDGAMGRITSLVVDERHRGGGAGSVLVAAAESWFRSVGCVKAEVTSGNQRAGAHRFYERHGYRHDSRRFAKPMPPHEGAAAVRA